MQQGLLDIAGIFDHSVCNGANLGVLGQPLLLAETPLLEEIKEFKPAWLNEARKLKMPHWNVGLKLFETSANPAVKWTTIRPYTNLSGLFENPPTVDSLIADLH